MKTLFKSLICIFVMSIAGSASAGGIREYTADMVDVKSGRVVQKLAVMPDKLYSESLDGSGEREASAIIRLDQQKMFIFMEQGKMYMELPFNKDKFTAADLSLGMAQTKQEKVGTETVGGYQADKFQITATVMGMTTTAYQWIAPEFDPLPIRTEAEGVVLEMRNIEPGRPAAALFELPQGYTRNTAMEAVIAEMMK